MAEVLRWLRRAWRAIARPFQRTPLAAEAFEGAANTRLFADWVLTPLTSADQEIRGDLKTLVARSRELARNNAMVARYLGLLEENVAGPYGIALQARTADKELNSRIEAAWIRWGRPQTCTVDQRLSWIGVQQLAIRTVAQDGECFIRMLPGLPNHPFGFALQVLDADQVDRDFNRAARPGEPEVRMGVEVDEYGRPLAYWVHRAHPNDWLSGRRSTERIRVPAEQMIHLYQMRRPGQTRGVPWVTPVMYDARMLHGLQTAELVAARIAAAKGGFFEVDPEAALPDPNRTTTPKRIQMEVEPGVFDSLPPGYRFRPWDPQHPNTAFAEFQRAIQRNIATGLRASYHALSGDLTQVSYSSIRDGTLRDRDTWESMQWWLIEHLHERVYPLWLLWAATVGAVELPTFDIEQWGAHEWLPRSWPWVDPLKDVRALEREIALGITSRTRAAGRRGDDWEEVVDELAREREILRRYGLDAGPGADPTPDVDEEKELDDVEAQAWRLVAVRRNGGGEWRL